MSSKRAKKKFWGVGGNALKELAKSTKLHASINRFPHRIIEEEHVNDRNNSTTRSATPVPGINC